MWLHRRKLLDFNHQTCHTSSHAKAHIPDFEPSGSTQGVDAISAALKGSHYLISNVLALNLTNQTLQMDFLSSLQYALDSDTSSTSSSSPLLDSCSLSSPYSETDDVFSAVVRSRKSWKTLKGGKMVWPLHLEAALLEGLSAYKPDNSRETLLLGRFPMRNRFISEYIFKTTGELRTAKQVGSRLQQLRDTASGGKKCKFSSSSFPSDITRLTRERKPKTVQKLLSPTHHSRRGLSDLNHAHFSPYRSRSLSLDSSAPTSPMTTASLELADTLSPTVMYIDILAENSPSQGNHVNMALSTTTTTPLDPSITSSHEPRPIRMIQPCLVFTAGTHSITAFSRFVVSHRDVLYEDSSSLLVISDHDSFNPPAGKAMYSCDLVPNYWNNIRDSSDPTEFTIFHNIVQESSFDVLYSATYKFRLVSPTGQSITTLTGFQGVNSELLGDQVESLEDFSGTSARYDDDDDDDNRDWQDSLDSLSNTSSGRPSASQWDDCHSSSSSSSSPASGIFYSYPKFGLQQLGA
ncbi:hypothetical protein D9757_004868 [Collybiopsis confluens]|uniref:TEA domain-containing protein n=1 Tax=Collybiopsis confluens TaxID=2823264 RepID=A0A8H5HSI2_9AGAR|nr:hypothetical protein D9757_004868 [Collybiopsis confluens]